MHIIQAKKLHQFFGPKYFLKKRKDFSNNAAMNYLRIVIYLFPLVSTYLSRYVLSRYLGKE